MAAMAKKQSARVLSSKTVYRGPVFTVTTDRVLEPGGVKARRDVVHHPGSVVILPVDDTGREPRVLLIRQFRHAAGKPLWELPAGRIDAGEAARAAAARELIEETGFRATRWKRVLFFYASPGFLDETMAVWMATGLRPGAAAPEDDENIRQRFFPLSVAARMARSGRLQDGKTIAAVLWLASSPRRHRSPR